MAVTITRTAWIDDDGTGTTGTVINNAVKTGLYNEIDAALAKVAQLAGGNTFTGGQNVQYLWASTAAGVGTTAQIGGASFNVSVPAPNPAIAIQNTNAGSPSMYYMLLYNAASGLAGFIQQTGDTTVTFSTSSDARLKDDAGRAADLAALRAVVVHDFTWKADGVRDRGVFAQEAHAHYPRAVSEGTDETTATGALARPWMTDYSKFVPDLIVGWQQHDAELAELRALLTTEGL
jgi:hypothetical protein